MWKEIKLPNILRNRGCEHKELIPSSCEWRPQPWPWMSTGCGKSVTHQLYGVQGDVEEDRGAYFIVWYVCKEHAMEGVSWGYAVAFNLQTNKSEGVYID
jgi:hypothetical protein